MGRACNETEARAQRIVYTFLHSNEINSSNMLGTVITCFQFCETPTHTVQVRIRSASTAAIPSRLLWGPIQCLLDRRAGLQNPGFTRQPLSKEFCARRRLCHHEPPLLIPGRLPNIGRIRHPPIQFFGFCSM